MNIVEIGTIYKILFDPTLRYVHHMLTSLIEKDKSIIDVACGTGALTFLIAKKSKKVIGIDLSRSMLQTAIKQKERYLVKNIEFLEKDATKLDCFNENELDIAVISMGLHQFTPETGIAVLNEMKRISREIIVLDYFSPLPKNINGIITRLIEFSAGKEHNGNFKQYIKNGGIPALAQKVDLCHKYQTTTKDKVFTISIYSK